MFEPGQVIENALSIADSIDSLHTQVNHEKEIETVVIIVGGTLVKEKWGRNTIYSKMYR